MTYCLAIRVEEGLVFCSDSRTNAGIDNMIAYSKMHRFSWTHKRHFTLLSSGNLATTQAVVKKLHLDINENAPANLQTIGSLQEAVDYVGRTNALIQHQQNNRDLTGTNFEATFIFGGQIAGHKPEIFLVYPQGNYIHESHEHPFLQIGETKYGKPILDRVIVPGLDLARAGRCALVSMNSTTRSNATVGPPLELLMHKNNVLEKGLYLHLTDTDPFLQAVSSGWNEGLILALENLPKFAWEEDREDDHAVGRVRPFPFVPKNS